jgi:nitroreductase
MTSALHWRYATKRYDSSRKISEQDLTTLLESIRLSPSSYGLQPFKVILIENPDIREQLKAHSWNQTQTTEASHFLVFAASKLLPDSEIDSHIERTAKTRQRAVSELQGYGDFVKSKVHLLSSDEIANWNAKQAYIAMGFLLFQAALLEIDATPMEGLDPTAYDAILNLSDHQTVFAVALGYRSEEDSLQFAKKVRKAANELIEKV